MKVKRFTATNTRLALQQAKEALGEDAVILANKSVDNGVEIIAANELDQSSVEFAAGPSMEFPDANQQVNNVKNEIAALRGLLEHQLTGLAWNHYRHAKPSHAKLLQQLHQLGLVVDVAQGYIDSILPEQSLRDSWLQILNAIAEDLVIIDHNRDKDQPAIYALVGPTGTGKTSTIAKLTALYAQQYGYEKVGLVSFDDQRIAAAEQLNKYAMMFGVAAKTAYDPQTLMQALFKFRDKHIVLIDTPGISQRNQTALNELKILESCGKHIKVQLTLAANTQYSTLVDTIQQFSIINLHSVILTKVDECRQLGEVMSVLLKSQLALSYTTSGQTIPGDIELAQPQKLINRAVMLSQALPTRVNEASLAYQFHDGVADDCR